MTGTLIYSVLYGRGLGLNLTTVAIVGDKRGRVGRRPWGICCARKFPGVMGG